MNLNDLRSMDRDDLLRMVGLETRRSAADYLMPALGLFGAGLVVGAGLGLLLAPKSGREIRGELTERMQEVRERANAEKERLQKEK
jgi:hypothetical protein